MVPNGLHGGWVSRIPGEKSRDQILGLFVAAVAFLVYANSLGNGFTIDDPSVILDNPVLRGGPLSLFSAIDTTSDTQLLPFYRPLTYLTFLIERRLHGFSPFPMHLVNVLLHAANAFLVFRLARTLFADHAPALLAGLLFSVHPIHTEGVNYLSGGRNTMLACFFILLAYLFHRRSVIRDRISSALIGAVFFFAGLLSKEAALAVLPFIVAQEVPPLREKTPGSRSRAAARLLPYAAAAAGYLALRWMTMSKLGVQAGPIPGFSTQMMQDRYLVPGLAERLLNNLYIIPKNFMTVVCPIALNARYVVPDDLHLLALPLLAAWLVIITGLVWLLTRGRTNITLFGSSWAVAFWLPMSGVIFFSDIVLADRYLYIPAVGLWMVAADRVRRSLPAVGTSRRIVIAAVLVILLLLSAVTIRRNLDWKSDLTLFARAVEQYPDNPPGHYHLGRAYLQRSGANDLELAENEFEAALALDPSLQSVHTPLGYIRLERGDPEGALYHYSQALALLPVDREARINRGIAFEKLGRYEEALDDYRFYLSLPGYNNIPGSREYAEARVRELTLRVREKHGD